jgi:hypothetical protein
VVVNEGGKKSLSHSLNAMEQNIITPEEFVAACRKEGKIYIPRLKGYEFNPLTYIDAANWLVKAIKGDIQDNPDTSPLTTELEQSIWAPVEGTINAAGDNAYNAMLAARRRRGLPITSFCLDLAEATRQNALRSAGGVRREIANKRLDIQNENMKSTVKKEIEERRFTIYPKVGERYYTITNENHILGKMYYYDSWSRNSLFYIAQLVRFILEQIGADEFKRSVIDKFGVRIENIEFKDFEEIGPDIQSIVADQINMAVS